MTTDYSVSKMDTSFNNVLANAAHVQALTTMVTGLESIADALEAAGADSTVSIPLVHMAQIALEGYGLPYNLEPSDMGIVSTESFVATPVVSLEVLKDKIEDVKQTALNKFSSMGSEMEKFRKEHKEEARKLDKESDDIIKDLQNNKNETQERETLEAKSEWNRLKYKGAPPSNADLVAGVGRVATLEHWAVTEQDVVNMVMNDILTTDDEKAKHIKTVEGLLETVSAIKFDEFTDDFTVPRGDKPWVTCNGLAHLLGDTQLLWGFKYPKGVSKSDKEIEPGKILGEFVFEFRDDEGADVDITGQPIVALNKADLSGLLGDVAANLKETIKSKGSPDDDLDVKKLADDIKAWYNHKSDEVTETKRSKWHTAKGLMSMATTYVSGRSSVLKYSTKLNKTTIGFCKACALNYVNPLN